MALSTGISGQINFPWGMWDGYSRVLPALPSTGISGQVNFPWGMWDGWSPFVSTSSAAPTRVLGREDDTWLTDRITLIV